MTVHHDRMSGKEQEKGTSPDPLIHIQYRPGRHEGTGCILDETIQKQGGETFVDSWLFLAISREKGRRKSGRPCRRRWSALIPPRSVCCTADYCTSGRFSAYSGCKRVREWWVGGLVWNAF